MRREGTGIDDLAEIVDKIAFVVVGLVLHEDGDRNASRMNGVVVEPSSSTM
jgi:hypothetical protein